MELFSSEGNFSKNRTYKDILIPIQEIELCESDLEFEEKTILQTEVDINGLISSINNNIEESIELRNFIIDNSTELLSARKQKEEEKYYVINNKTELDFLK